MKTKIKYLTALIAILLCTACGRTIMQYEIEQVYKLFGGAEETHSIWLDAGNITGKCKDGYIVTPNRLK